LPNTSSELIASLHHQPLLVVLRAEQPLSLQPTLRRLQDLGVRHIELAWSSHPQWLEQCAHLADQHGGLSLGAASIATVRALEDAAAAGLRFAVSPVLQPELLRRAAALQITLVPGVMTPTEILQARDQGCAMVKLFPAVSLGSGYWQRLQGPLGPLPFCIAAGGLGPTDLAQWLASGVDAVAIGGALHSEQTWVELANWIATRRR
jgi:2-dehydro-3-deoxyphosphogluconate aldolase/(4S)-4-hydroxy-2-oxoglutarate aldolase